MTMLLQKRFSQHLRRKKPIAFGAAALAGLAVGVWNGFDELAALRRSQCVFRPQREEEACLADLARWHRAVERSRSWIENNV